MVSIRYFPTGKNSISCRLLLESFKPLALVANVTSTLPLMRWCARPLGRGLDGNLSCAGAPPHELPVQIFKPTVVIQEMLSNIPGNAPTILTGSADRLSFRSVLLFCDGLPVSAPAGGDWLRCSQPSGIPAHLCVGGGCLVGTVCATLRKGRCRSPYLHIPHVMVLTSRLIGWFSFKYWTIYSCRPQHRLGDRWWGNLDGGDTRYPRGARCSWWDYYPFQSSNPVVSTPSQVTTFGVRSR